MLQFLQAIHNRLPNVLWSHRHFSWFCPYPCYQKIMLLCESPANSFYYLRLFSGNWLSKQWNKLWDLYVLFSYFPCPNTSNEDFFLLNLVSSVLFNVRWNMYSISEKNKFSKNPSFSTQYYHLVNLKSYQATLNKHYRLKH